MLFRSVGPLENLGVAFDDLRAGMGVVVIAEADARAGVRFDEDLVAVLDELIGRRGKEGDAVLLGFDFLGDADDHGKIDGWRDMRMGDRIKALGDALPNEIVANAGVFGLLSKGIHELSDTDAEALFPLVKAVIFQMLGDEQRHLEAKRARRDIDAALQSAIAKMASGNG